VTTFGASSELFSYGPDCRAMESAIPRVAKATVPCPGE